MAGREWVWCGESGSGEFRCGVLGQGMAGKELAIKIFRIVDIYPDMGCFRIGFEKEGAKSVYAVSVPVVEAVAKKIISIWKESNGNT